MFIEWRPVEEKVYDLEQGEGTSNDQDWAVVDSVGYKPDKGGTDSGKLLAFLFARHYLVSDTSFSV